MMIKNIFKDNFKIGHINVFIDENKITFKVYGITGFKTSKTTSKRYIKSTIEKLETLVIEEFESNASIEILLLKEGFK